MCRAPAPTTPVLAHDRVLGCLLFLHQRFGYLPVLFHHFTSYFIPYLRFERALRDSGLPPFRFHDLRHHAASQMHALGIPDRYIEAIGGWKPGSTVLKRVYENVIDEERTKIENLYEENSSFTV